MEAATTGLHVKNWNLGLLLLWGCDRFGLVSRLRKLRPFHSAYWTKEGCCWWWRSSVFLEANKLSLLSERSSGHVNAVLSDESLLATSNSAATRVLTELSWMTQQLLLHTSGTTHVLTATGYRILQIHVIYLSLAYLSIIIIIGVCEWILIFLFLKN